jgi:hypothetical protein
MARLPEYLHMQTPPSLNEARATFLAELLNLKKLT